MPDSIETKLVESLTKKAEEGEPISDALNLIPFSERLKIARKMDELNDANRLANPELPDLILSVEIDAGGAEHLTDLQSRKKGTLIDSREDLYDLPKTAQAQFLDYILDSRLERDSEDSKHLSSIKQNKGVDFYIGAGERKN